MTDTGASSPVGYDRTESAQSARSAGLVIAAAVRAVCPRNARRVKGAGCSRVICDPIRTELSFSHQRPGVVPAAAIFMEARVVCQGLCTHAYGLLLVRIGEGGLRFQELKLRAA